MQLYKTYIRSVVWSSSLTQKNKKELERVQKVAVRLINKSELPYEENLKLLNMETLNVRRQILSERFAEKCLKNKKTKNMFEENENNHGMNLRNKEKYKIKHANTVRLQISAIPTMTKHLNAEHETQRKIFHINP